MQDASIAQGQGTGCTMVDGQGCWSEGGAGGIRCGPGIIAGAADGSVTGGGSGGGGDGGGGGTPTPL